MKTLKQTIWLTIAFCLYATPVWAFTPDGEKQSSTLNDVISSEPKGKREARHLREKIGSLIIAKLNEGVNADNTIVCKKEIRVVNFLGAKLPEKSCHILATYNALDQISMDYKNDLAMYRCAGRVFDTGKTSRICVLSYRKFKTKSDAEKAKENQQIKARMAKLASKDTEFAMLIRKAKELRDKYAAL